MSDIFRAKPTYLNVTRVTEYFFRGDKGGTFVQFAAGPTALHASPQRLVPAAAEAYTARALLCLSFRPRRLLWSACHQAHGAPRGQ
jgi:hypothetical protein